VDPARWAAALPHAHAGATRRSTVAHHQQEEPDMTRKRSRVLGAVAAGLVLAATSACNAGLTDPSREFELANGAVDRWVRAHQEGWTLNLGSARALTRPSWSQPCSQDPHSGMVTLRHEAAGTQIDVSFRCPVDETSTLEELTTAFSHVVLEELPHGIRSRGWRFRVLTPSSSVSQGVTLTQPSTGSLRVQVQTPLYAVYGHSERPVCQPPADAPSPEGCYLLVEHPITLSLTLTAPFDRGQLR
jgi:hypothetical protein